MVDAIGTSVQRMLTDYQTITARKQTKRIFCFIIE